METTRMDVQICDQFLAVIRYRRVYRTAFKAMYMVQFEENIILHLCTLFLTSESDKRKSSF